MQRACFIFHSSLNSRQLINEPFAGAVLQYPDLLLPGVAGSRNLQPLYDALGAAIRHVDQRHIIFYEPVTWGMVEEDRFVSYDVEI